MHSSASAWARGAAAALRAQRLSHRLQSLSTAAVSRAVQLPRSAFPVLRPLQTRWSDNDSYGHINNVQYYSFFDTAVNTWLLEQRFPSSEHAIGLVVDSGCSFFEPAAFPEALEVGLGVAHVGRSSVRYRLGVFRQGAASPAAQGHFVHAYVDVATRRSCPIPPDVRSALSGHMLRLPAAAAAAATPALHPKS